MTFLVSILLMFFSPLCNAYASTPILNLAREPGVSYSVSPGNFSKEISADRDNILIDGVKDQGAKTGVCYEFWNKPPEESYITVDLDLGASFPISAISLFGRHHASSYHITRLRYSISEDGIVFTQVGEVLEESIVQPVATWGNWSDTLDVGWQSARFIRVTAWTGEAGYYVNLEEIEVFGAQKPATPQNVNVERLSSSKVEISWEDLGEGYSYRIYRSTSQDFIPSTDNLIASNLTESFFSDDQIDGLEYYYRVAAFVMAGEIEFEGEASEVEAVAPVAMVRGVVIDEAGLVLSSCKVSIADINVTTMTNSEGIYILDNILVGMQLQLRISKTGYYPAYQTVLLAPGQQEVWDVTLILDQTPGVKNLAREPRVSYSVSPGTFSREISADRDNILVDGVKDQGGKTGVCYEFWNKPPEESYITVDLDLGATFPISTISLFGKHHATVYHVGRVRYAISDDGVVFTEVGENYGENILQPTTGTWSDSMDVGWQSTRFVRVTAWARLIKGYQISLEEIEVFGAQKPVTPQNLNVERLSSSSAKISWESLGEGYFYRVYRSTNQDFLPSVDNLIADDLTEATFIDTEIDAQEYYYRIVAFIIAGNIIEFEGETSEAVSAVPVAIVRGTVKNEAGLFLTNCKVSVASMGLITWTDDAGAYVFDMLSIETQLQITIEKTGYYRAYKTFVLAPQQEEIWDVTLILDQTPGVKNLAREPGASYSVSPGNFSREIAADRDNILIDGVKDQDGKVGVCYEFWNKPPEESYITVDLDLGASYPINAISLFGKNHANVYHVGRVRYSISDDGVVFTQVGEVFGENIVQPEPWGTWSNSVDVGWQLARFVRVTAWTRLIKGYQISLEEIEVLGLTRAAKVEGLTVQRLAEDQARLNWTNQGAGIVYRVYRSEDSIVEPIADNLVADNLQTAFFVDDSINSNRYYYTVTACVAVGQDRFEGESSEERELSPVGKIEGYIDGDREIDPQDFANCTIEVEGTGLITTANIDGSFSLPLLPAERELSIIVRLKGYQKQSITPTLNPGQVFSWNPTLILDIYPPNPPVNVEAKALSPGLIQLTWDTPQPHPEDQNLPSYYNVYRAMEAVFEINENNLLVSGLVGTQYPDKNIENDNFYYYAIVAYDEADNDAAPVRVEAQAIPVPTISSVQPIGGMPTVGDVHFKWSNVEGALSYILEYAQNEAFENVESTGELTGCEYIASSLASGIWYWRVRALLPYEVATDYSPVQSFSVDAIEDDCLNVRKITIYPNPANPLQGDISFGYILDQAGSVMLKIFNTSGKLVRSVDLGRVSAGAVQYNWDGLDNTGRLVNNGVYLVLISATNYQVEPRRAEGKALLLINK